MADPIYTMQFGGESVYVYRQSEIAKPYLALDDGGAIKLTTDGGEIDTSVRTKFGDGTLMGVRSELVTEIESWAEYSDGEKPGPWATGSSDLWVVKNRSWARDGKVYRLEGYNVDGSESRHTGGSLPGDGLDQYCPPPPFDLYVGLRIGSESYHEVNFHWNIETRSYESYRNVLEYEPDINSMNTGQKGPNKGFTTLDETSVDVPSNTDIEIHVHQKANGHWEVDTLGKHLDSRAYGNTPKNITDDYFGYGFSIGDGDIAEISYIDLDK